MSATRSSSSSRWCRRRCARSGMGRHDIGFTISGSCDYLSGGPFTFVQGLDGAGAWPPVRESHVEMDAAWALYEAWVAIQTGEVDSALIYGFGKSSLTDVYQVFTMQSDPYTVTPLWPSLIHFAGAAGERAARVRARSVERDLAEVAARSSRDARGNPHAIRKEDVDADALLGAPGDPRAAARRRHLPGHRRCVRDGDRGRRRRPRALRATGVDPGHRPPDRRAAHRRARPHRRASRPGAPARRPARCRAASTSPSSTRSSAPTS